jgi:thiosulfate/3-mercaptopyruvate sulfurtransferase
MALATLATTQALQEHLAAWRVFDCRHDLAQPDLGERQYRESHIPGARFAHLDRDLSAPKDGTNGRHPLPERGAFIAWLGEQGLKASDPVVCYDAGNAMMAARLWWMLRWAGHDTVAVLDGGFARWQAERREVSASVPDYPRTRYPVRKPLHESLAVDEVQAGLKQLLLVDARSAARFRGEQEPIDPVAGHIPGAKNRYAADNLAADGRFKDPASLRAEFETVLGGRPAQDLVNYCGSGVAAAHNALAMHIAGLPGSRLYAGSWSEWISDPKRPRATGDE